MAQMQRVGGIDAHGYDVYYAEPGRFTQPGLWAWDGVQHRLLLSEDELRARMNPVEAVIHAEDCVSADCGGECDA